MKYLVSVIDDSTATTVDDGPTDGESPVDAFNDRLRADGHWVFAGGLAAPEAATVIDARKGQAVFVDGPFVESKEYLGGLWILEAADLDEALKLATVGSKACNRRVEVRPFAD